MIVSAHPLELLFPFAAAALPVSVRPSCENEKVCVTVMTPPSDLVDCSSEVLNSSRDELLDVKVEDELVGREDDEELEDSEEELEDAVDELD